MCLLFFQTKECEKARHEGFKIFTISQKISRQIKYKTKREIYFGERGKKNQEKLKPQYHFTKKKTNRLHLSIDNWAFVKLPDIMDYWTSLIFKFFVKLPHNKKKTKSFYKK